MVIGLHWVTALEWRLRSTICATALDGNGIGDACLDGHATRPSRLARRFR
jgi:hypothetical protein